MFMWFTLLMVWAYHCSLSARHSFDGGMFKIWQTSLSPGTSSPLSTSRSTSLACCIESWKGLCEMHPWTVGMVRHRIADDRPSFCWQQVLISSDRKINIFLEMADITTLSAVEKNRHIKNQLFYISALVRHYILFNNGLMGKLRKGDRQPDLIPDYDVICITNKILMK